MDHALRHIANCQDGVVVRRQALDAGYDDKEIARLRSDRRWTAIRRGAYVETSLWASLDGISRHRALVRAVLLQLADPPVLSHVSAAVMLGLPVWNIDLSTVHVTREGHSPRLEAGVHHHVGALPESEVVVLRGGVLVTAPARTVVDVARSVPFEPAVVTADGALARPDVSPEQVLAVLDDMRDWRGARQAGRVVAFADGRAESVGESRHRVQIARIGLPAPELQVEIPRTGKHSDRVDFYFEEFSTVGEFDGREKYERLRRVGETPADALWREKRREDRLREHGFEVVRPTWADLYNDELVAKRYRAAFARARRPRQVA